MKNLLFPCLLFVFVLPLHAQSGKTYGNGVHVSDTTKVSEILEHPEKYVGKTVKVEGLIVDVCSKRGCWMELAGDKPFTRIRVKVTDGEIVFPVSAKGQMAVVEGEVSEIKLTKEQALERAKHMAEEYGTTFDPAAVKDTVYYQLKGLGAIIR